MSYIVKYSKIRPFVKLNIPHNKKMFTTNEKRMISQYFNKLETQGYFNNEREGYVIKKINKTSYKVPDSPRLKAVFVNVGTNSAHGKITTDTNAKIRIRNGRFYIQRKGMPYRFEFFYEVKKDWKLKPFARHLLQQMSPDKPRKGYIYIIGAGIYEAKTGHSSEIEGVAREILKLMNAYGNSNQFLGKVLVYQSEESFKLRSKIVKRKKQSKRDKIKGR